MRVKDTKHIIIGVILLFFMIGNGLAQVTYNFHKGGGIWRHYYVNANAGANLFFGDVSNYNGDPFNKLVKESSFAYSATAGKWITEWLAAQATFNMGQLRGANNALDAEFKNHYYYYTGEFIVNLNQLVYPLDKQTDFYLQAKLGFGLIRFNSELTSLTSKKPLHIIGENSAFGERVTEWIVPIGIGGVYNIDEHYSILFDLLYQYVNSDKLDTRVEESINNMNQLDSFFLLSVGIKYTFNLKKLRGYNHGSNSRSLRWTR